MMIATKKKWAVMILYLLTIPGIATKKKRSGQLL
jgi:hypothetical protein